MSLFGGDSRADKVAAALGAGAGSEIESVLTLGAISPWNLAQDFDPSVTAQVAAQGGAAIGLQIGGGPLGATLGNLTGPFTLALMWDDEKPAIVQTVEEGQSVVLKIGPPLGEQLSVWTDTVIAVSLVGVQPPEAADKIAAQLNASAPAPSLVSSIGDAVKTIGGKAIDFQQTTIQTVIVVGALAVLAYFLFSGPINRVAAGAAGGAA